MQVGRADATAEFDRAVALAESGKPLPEEWILRTERLGEARSKTLIAMLGTALVARATDERIDPLALKDSAPAMSGLEPYSARGLAQHVLVPSAVRHGVHLGVTGREPLNNQPFYAEGRVRRDMPTRPGDREHLGRLVDALERIAGMTRDEARSALAAFIRVRQEVAIALRPHIEVEGRPTTLPALVDATATFISDNPEGGKRGQAFVAAALDLAYTEVVTGRINDPSRRGPGDVRAFRDAHLRLPVEVKQKPVTDTDVLLFAQAIAEWGLPGGLCAALDPQQPDLNEAAINSLAIESYGVGIDILMGVGGVLAAVAAWGLVSVEELLERFPKRMLARMEELEVSVDARRAWARLFKQ